MKIKKERAIKLSERVSINPSHSGGGEEWTKFRNLAKLWTSEIVGQRGF